MASLTPGTLRKLLQNAGNKDFRVAGEHRSALLQVISIVPSLEDDPWKSRGYYLRVSDSLHSAYVSVSDEDVELILSDKVQLGQFIHVTWLDSGSPVPVLRGIKPISKRRPCVGEPKDLISSEFLNAKKVETKVKSKGKVKKVVGSEQGSNLRRLSFGNGKVGGGVESRRLSLDSARKGWDSSLQSKNGVKCVASKAKSKDNALTSDSVAVKKAVSEESSKSLSFSTPLKNKNIIVSPKIVTKPVKSVKSSNDDTFPISPNIATKPVKSVKSSNDDTFPIDYNKVALGSKKLSELKILWEALPTTICDLGKEVRSHRKVAFVSAVRALEEASISEGVIQCMSMFGELCELSQKDTSGPLVEQFLNIYESIKKASKVIRTMINVGSSETKDSNECSSQGSLWVQAAVQTDLSKFSLYTKGGNGVTNSEQSHYVVIENTLHKIDTEKNHSTKSKPSPISSSKPAPKLKKETSHSRTRLSTTKEPNAEQEKRLPGSGLKHVAKLSEKLLSFSRAWFLDYLEDSLNNGFGLRRDEASQMATLLGQLKRVNQWLDEAFQGDQGDERIERLRKKLYQFLLNNVDSANF